MLDELPLSTKLTVAREWFRRSRAGEFPLTGGTADRFAELLEQCIGEATELQDALAGDREVDPVLVFGGDTPAALAAVRAELERMVAEQRPLKAVLL